MGTRRVFVFLTLTLLHYLCIYKYLYVNKYRSIPTHIRNTDNIDKYT